MESMKQLTVLFFVAHLCTWALAQPTDNSDFVQVVGCGSLGFAEAIGELQAVYGKATPFFQGSYQSLSEAGMRSALALNACDYGLSAMLPSQADIVQTPDLIALPIAAIPLVFRVCTLTHQPSPEPNLRVACADMLSGTITPTLSLDILAKIYLGHIRMWNDSSIQVRSACLVAVRAPSVVSLCCAGTKS